MAKVLGPSYALRCIVFHDISAAESPFTKGMGVSVTPSGLEAALRFVTRYYTPTSLEEILADSGRQSARLPRRPVLVTFDDGYASAARWASALCLKFGVPAVFFLNAAVLDNVRLAPDNLICYVANVLGMGTIEKAVRIVMGSQAPRVRCLSNVFASFLPAISLTQRQLFLEALVRSTGFDEAQLAREAGLYLTREETRELALRFEVGNHTFTHVHCRSLTPLSFTREILNNKLELEALSGRKVRSFSLPYGSSADLSDGLACQLRDSGHQAVFLSQSVANARCADPLHFDRVSIRGCTEDSLFLQLEILPRLRAAKSRFLRPYSFLAESGEQERDRPEPVSRVHCSGTLERIQQ